MSHLNQISLISHIFYSTFVNICNNGVDFNGGNCDDEKEDDDSTHPKGDLK